MTYSPINVAAYTAAFSGAVAGMGVSGWITDQNSTDYTNVTLIAGAFAQAFDKVWNNATQLNNLELAAITATVQTDFTGRGPGPFNNPTFQDPNNWTQSAGACAALVLESDIFFTNENINPGISQTIYYTGIGGSSSDTLALQAVLASAATQLKAVELIGPNPINLDFAGNIGKTIPSETRITCSPGEIINLDQPVSLTFFSLADREIFLGKVAVTQTVCNIIIPGTLTPIPVVGDTIFTRGSNNAGNDSGGVYDIISLGQANIGTVDISTNSLYGGSSTLDGKTLILNVNGGGLQTLLLNKTTNVATENAFLTAIIAKWPALNLCIADRTTNVLVLSATSLIIGAGTANTYLGLVTGAATNLSMFVDRPVVWPFEIGAIIDQYVNPPHDIDIDMRGALLQGASGQIFEVTAGKRYSVRNVNYHYRASDPIPPLGISQVGGLDLGTRDSEVVNITARNDNVGAPNGYAGWFLQANERTIIRDCRFEGFTELGYNMGDCYSCQSINNWTIQCGYAHAIEGDFSNGPTYGCIDCSIEGGGDIGSTYSLFISGAIRSKVLNFSSMNAVIYGANISSAVGYITDDIQLIGCSFVNAPIGVVITSNVTNVRCFGLTTDNCQSGIQCSSGIEVHGWKMSSSAKVGTFSTLALLDGIGPYKFEGFDISSTTTSMNGFTISSTGTVQISNGSISLNPTGICLILNSTATVYIDNVKFIGNYGLNVNAGIVIVGPNCDFSGCNGAFYPGAGKIIWMNQGGLLSLSLAGFPSYGLTAVQLANKCIELNGLLGADTVVHFTQNIGEEWTITNNTTGAHTLTLIESPAVASGVILAQTKTAIVRIASNGALAQVSAPF
jgi:hypothetical protein